MCDPVNVVLFLCFFQACTQAFCLCPFFFLGLGVGETEHTFMGDEGAELILFSLRIKFDGPQGGRGTEIARQAGMQ